MGKPRNKRTRDPLITDAVIATAEELIFTKRPKTNKQRLHDEEPDLYYRISSIGNTALADLEGVSLEMHEAAERAVWFAAIIALESYRLAYYRLWRGTQLGELLEQLEPRTRKGPSRPRVREQLDGPPEAGPEQL
jgi:hypothetical protein